MRTKPLNRTLWSQDYMGPDYEARGEPRQVNFAFQANLLASKMRDGRHAPVLDLDVPAKMVPSKTPGNHHLYIDVPMSWFRYKVLLRVLGWVGILEPGYVRASIRRGWSAARINTHVRTDRQRELQRLFRAEQWAARPPIPNACDELAF